MCPKEGISSCAKWLRGHTGFRLFLYVLLWTGVLLPSLHALSPPISKEDGVVILSRDAVYNGDFFATGRTIEIAGVVNGDVYVIGGQILIDGIINGDLLALGGSTDISGTITQNCRIMGGQVLFSGRIGENLSVLSGNLQLLSSGSIGKDLVSAAGIVDVASSIGSTVTVIASNMRVSSSIHRNLQGYVGKLRLTSTAKIDGDLDYRSDTPALVDPGAVIKGKVLYQPSFLHRIMDSAWVHKLFAGSKVLITLMNFFYTLIFGAFLIKLFPKNTHAAIFSLYHHPVKAFFYGSLIIIFIPLILIVLLITILGVPFALALMAMNIIGFYTAKIYPILWATHWACGKMEWKQNQLWSFALMTVVYFVLAAIPLVGSLLSCSAFLVGLGAGVLAQQRPRDAHLSSP